MLPTRICRLVFILFYSFLHLFLLILLSPLILVFGPVLLNLLLLCLLLLLTLKKLPLVILPAVLGPVCSVMLGGILASHMPQEASHMPLVASHIAMVAIPGMPDTSAVFTSVTKLVRVYSPQGASLSSKGTIQSGSHWIHN